ncbi:glycosyltransferase family 4 protein [Floridanema evergladense]|uniref:Glycosyltransferase family 4 protein n=1 Tax=Floridaenema evergladense BLCC-F167 TaxID=3153639 RepID=A0ABV4WX93_9CYAN
MSFKKFKILLSAFVCHPEKGSEEGIGWNWLKELSKEHEVYALISCFLDQEEPVRAAVEELSYRENIHLIFIPMPQGSNKIMSLFPILEFYYLCVEWQKQALAEAKKLLEKVDIDIIHHVTYGSWTIPSFLWQLPKPFVLGPVTGSQKVPLVGYLFLPPKAIVQELVRIAYFLWVRMTSVASREAVKKAKLVLCGNLETLSEISSIKKSGKSLFFLDVGVSYTSELAKASEQTTGGCNTSTSISLLWAGLIEPRKNFGLLLEALKILPSDIQWKLTVAGTGPLLTYWQDKVSRLGLHEKINFLGQIPYIEMSKCYQTSDIFVFPSLREGTGTVILEALANRLPVIALRLNGAATVLADDCGVLIEVRSKKQMINDFADAITSLSRDRDLRRKIGEKGYERVRSFYTWEKRGKQMSSLYQKVLDGIL